MNSKRSLMALVTAITIFSMLLSMAIPVADFVAQAQDAPTETPTETAVPTEVVPTDTPTEIPTALPTEEPTSEATAAPTDVPTEEVTEVPTATSTELPTATPTEIPTISVFQDDFQDGNLDDWSVTSGWSLGVEGENLFLTANTPNELADITNLNLADFSFAARIRLNDGNQIHIQFRSGAETYDLALDAAGNTVLSRNGAVLAQGISTTIADTSAGPVWHTLNLQAIGSLLTVSVDGVAQISFTDPTPLIEGGIRLLTDANNTGAVSVDQVVVGQPEVVVATETPVIITATPEVSETLTPTLEATSEVTPTLEPPVTGVVILSGDFESDLVGWTASEGTSVVLDTDTNHALLMAAGSTLMPTEAVYLADFQLDARLNIPTAPEDGSTSGLSFAFRAQDGKTYAVSVEAGQTVLYRNDGTGATAIATSPTTHDLNVWHSLSVNAQAGHLLVTIDGTVEVDYTDIEPLSNGQIAFVANSSVMLDDLAVTDFSAGAIEPTLAPTPAGLSDEEIAKLPGALATALDLYLKGDTEGALNYASAYFIPMDEQGHVRVIIRATEDTDGQTMATIIQQVGGTIESVNEDQVNVSIPLSSFIALINTPQIGTIELASIAVSTSSAQSPAAAPATGKAIGEGYDIVGANDWNVANVKGAAQKIAVIDTGFVGGVAAGEGCATNSGPIGGTGSGSHGIQVVQVICDIAPSAAITMYQADTAAELSTQLTAANGNDIILITMDLGVSASPGDGTGGTDANVIAVYNKIASARTAGKLVIVAAGNSHGRQVNFQYPGGNVNVVVPILATAGDIVRVSWSDWNGSTDYTTVLDDIGDADGIAAGISPNTATRGSGPPSRFFTVPSVGAQQRFAVANPPTPVDPGTPPAGAIGCYNNASVLPQAAPSGAVRNYCELQLTISGSASAYFQVQVQTRVNLPVFDFDQDNAFSLPFNESSVINGSVTGGATNINTTSTIGRPADSPSALTVGAVCAFGEELDPATNYHILDTSSRGPILTAGGAGVSSPSLSARTSYKPNLVAPSDVSTSFDLALPNDTGKNSIQCNDTDNDGFSGTSAAAAHVAAMAALIRSNTDPELDTTVGAGININTDPDAIIDYMQSHSIDLYGENGTKPDGFDMTYGSGMPVLGNPAPTVPIAVDPATYTANTATCPGGSVRYVSPFNLSVERTLTSMGSLANPYITPAQALANASTNDCIVLLPGEYMSHIVINNATVPNNNIKLQSYKIVGKTVEPATLPGESTFWVNASFLSAGLAIRSTSSVNRNITIDGFEFVSATPLGQRDDNNPKAPLCSPCKPGFPPHPFPFPGAIGANFSEGTVSITNNSFTNFRQSAVIIGNSALTTGTVTIQDNLFKDNFSLGGLAVNVSNSGVGTPVLVQYNTFDRNRYIGEDTLSYEPVVQVTTSAINIYNNRFLNNQIRQSTDPIASRTPSTAIIRVNNTSDPNTAPNFSGSREVRVIGNAIFNNGNNGPVVDLEPSRRFRFINNTVVGNNRISSKPIIQRGTTNTNAQSDGATEINNNIFFQTDLSGTIPAGVFNDVGLGDYVCYNFAGSANSGAKNNWIYDVAGAESGGDCVFSFNNKPGGQFGAVDPTFKNVVNDPAHPITLASFVGTSVAPNDPYQIPGDSFGVGYGNNALLPGGSISTDVLKKPRIDPVGGNIDLGAYEYKAVTGTDFSITIPEDTLSSPIIMNQHVSGGFPPYKFLILNKPKNYGTSSTNACGGSPLTLTLDSNLQNIITYCPPPDFYNNAGTPAEAAVTFTYQVGDNSSTTYTDPPHTVTITVTKATTGPNVDLPLTTSVPLYTVLGEANKPLTLRLRPYIRFENFRFSETNNQSEYPFTYSSPSVQTTGQDGENTRLFDTGGATGSNDELAAAISAADYTGKITLTPRPDEIGFIEFTYSVTDDPALPGSITTTNNRIRIKVVGSIPSSGLHDDTSFNFDYRGAAITNPGVWTPVYNETAINNTLHTSTTANDTAEFVMNGSGFALYMQGAATGGNWELQVDNGGVTNTLAWTLNSTTGRYNAVFSASGATCTTAATTAAGALISNKTAAAYVVSCTGLLEGEANTIRVINKENKPLSIDAVGILLDTSPLLPAFHEVTEAQISSAFFGWTLLTDTRASGQRAMTTTNANIADVQFSFHGTGFAIGTVLEAKGAKYNVCAAPSTTPSNRVCQSFDNALGGTALPLFNVFRPFTGFDDDALTDYDVTIDVTSIPTGGRMLIDSIVVFDRKPTAVLSLGTTEDDQIGLIAFGGGLEDSWALDTTNVKASNTSLTSVSAAAKAGPYANFLIPDGADTISWYRVAGTTDSNQVLICVDRAQGDIAGDQSTHCVKKDLKTAGNPVIVKESDFDYNGSAIAGTGWGTAWGPNTTHSVEIFSLTSQPFNVDKIQVLDSDSQLLAGYYEENSPAIRFFTESSGLGTGTYTLLANGDNGNFTDVTLVSASGGKYKSLSADSVTAGVDTQNLYEGMFFQFTGTGFSTYFIMDTKADAVKICYLNNIFGSAPTGTDVKTVIDTGTCTIFDNQSTLTRYKAARTIAGLPANSYSVVVQMLDDQGEPAVHAAAAKPITMKLDAVEVYNHNPMPANVLTALGTRYETSYVNRVADARFVYIGAGWKSVSGATAKLYSGSNYDSLVNVIGGGVVFRTDGSSTQADSVIIYRDTRLGFAPMQVCVQRISPLARRCTIIGNAGGTGNQQPIVVPLFDNTAHTVSITTTDFGTFNLDAIELANNAPLPAGLYDENNAGITYSNTTDVTKPIRSHWTDLPVVSYTDKGAMQSNTIGASITFRFTGTGFSLLTLRDNLSGSLDVDIDGTAGNDYPNQTFNSNNATAVYGTSHTISGLTFDTYTVTITENDASKHRFTVDGLEIYGDYDMSQAMGVGIYDDASTNASNSNKPYLLYGPNNGSWTVKTGTLAAGYLNLTNHLTARYGAQTTFVVNGAANLTLFHNVSTTTLLRVCAKPVGATDGLTSWKCGTTTTAPARATTSVSLNNGTADIPLNAGGVGNYIISVTNLASAKNLYIDAVGVAGATTLGEGIYPESSPLLNFATTSWLTGLTAEPAATDKFVKSTGTGNSGDALSFSFTGTGFSIVLVESTATSSSYTLALTHTGSCGIVTDFNLPLTPANATAAKKPVALTYVGLDVGTTCTYNVTLTNNDSAKPMLVDRVDVLGALGTSRQIADGVLGNVENTDSRIIYFPFFSYNVLAAPAASAGSQHTGTMIGSVVYFELNDFTGTGFDYVRQTLATYGTASICTGAKGTNSAACTPTSAANNVAPLGYQQSFNVTLTPGADYNWVAIKNTDGKIMPLDFIRPRDVNQPITAGVFEETYPELKYVNGAGAPTSFVPVTNPAASGGATLSTTTLNDAMMFQFTGTGFGIRFTLDSKADAVKICWVNSLTTSLATVLAGTCQVPDFDNQSATPRYQAMRVINGLPSGNYTAAVQMLGDNGVPAVHTAAALPITMQIDGVAVYNGNWPGLTQLTTASRTETSFVNAAAQNKFIYFGDGWKSVSGTTAKLYSGSNYDSISNVIGAGVVFRTTGGDSIVLYRDTKVGTAPVQVCAALESAPSNRLCTTVINTGNTGVQQPVKVLLNNSNNTGAHVVTITTLDAGIFNLDAIEVVNTNAALQPGLYEDFYPGLNYSNPNLEPGETAWTNIFATTYTGGRAQQAIDDDAEMTFRLINATGFEIGTAMDKFGGEVEICYDSDGNNTWSDPTTRCFVYEDERTLASTTVSRTVTGLNTATTYAVRMRNVEDGKTVPTYAARLPANSPSRLRVDYVQIFGTALPPVTPAGYYNENAVDGSNVPYLQLLPANRWGTVSNATSFTFKTYATVVGTNNLASANYAGPVATLRVTIPNGAGAAGSATVILFTGTAVTTSTDRLLVCANDVAGADPITTSPPAALGTNCTIITNLKTSTQIILNESILSALGVDGSTVTLSFRALNPGTFRIDGYQVISGTTLSTGIYDDALFSSTGLITTTDGSATSKWTLAPATGTKFASAFGGSIAIAQSTALLTDDPTLTFNFVGTGFSIITMADALGTDLRICYKLTASPTAFPASSVLSQDGNVQQNGVFCRTRSTDTTIADWKLRNGGEPILATAPQYGFDYHGLPSGNYSVEVRLVDTTLAATDRLKIDAIAIFGTAGGSPITAGALYDNTQVGLTLSPSPFWTQTTATLTPPKGPWNKTLTSTTTAGAITQMNVTGNAIVIYQNAAATSSRYIRICLTTSFGQECSTFSQNKAAPTFFSPIVFYGLGTSGTHEVILENRDPGKTMSIDAVRVLP